MHLTPPPHSPVDYAAVPSRAVDLFLLIHCVMFLPLCVGVLFLAIVLLCITWCLFKFCNHIDGEERAGCFNSIVILMSCGCWCSVVLPHGTMGWSAVRDCGIS